MKLDSGIKIQGLTKNSGTREKTRAREKNRRPAKNTRDPQKIPATRERNPRPRQLDYLLFTTWVVNNAFQKE
jgi:hypothetical protein